MDRSTDQMTLRQRSDSSRSHGPSTSPEPPGDAREEDEQRAAFDAWLGDFFGHPSDTDDAEGQGRSDGG